MVVGGYDSARDLCETTAVRAAGRSIDQLLVPVEFRAVFPTAAALRSWFFVVSCT